MLEVYNLRCEYKDNPIGIDVKNPRISWVIKSDERNVLQASYQIQVSTDDKFKCIVWDTGKVDSDESIHVEYKGESLKSRTRYYYRVRVWDQRGRASNWSETAFWEMGLLEPDEWIASWITPNIEDGSPNSQACPLMRKAFEVKGEVKSARVYVTSLGLYELHLNGKRVGDFFFTPGWTSYNKRLQYQTYDVTEMLKEGQNAIGVILGNGWYKGNLTWEGRRNIYGDRLAALIQMYIIYKDGREQVVVSDRSWKASTGPILMSEIYHGEIYDARLEKPGWDEADYNDSDWYDVEELDKPKDIIIAQEGPPVRIVQQIKPVAILTTPAGETVLDMGQNMVGWVRFAVEGPAGSKVVLQHAEVLDKDGNFYTANLRSAKQTIEYILKGVGREVFEPHFTFQGFRYVKLVEYPGQPSLDDFVGMVVHSDMEPTGSFECSNPLVNRLQQNILWSQRGNFLDVPTDCPQRDERLGWTGDAQVFIRTACFNMNVASFFTKWLKDLKADQLSDGGVPFVIPNVLGDDHHSSAAWGDAAVICPWTVYLCYGDKRILEEQYDSMKAWVEYIRKQGDNEYLWNTGFHFGDWLGLDAKEGSYVGATATDFIATAFYAYSTSLLVKAAKVLGKTEDVEEYSKLYANIVDAFRKEFVTPNGRLAVPTQTAHVLALMFNLVEEKDRKRTIDTLVDYIKKNKYHLTTGFVGTPYLCHVLSQNGYSDVAYKLLLQTDYPSWLYQVTKGATTIWEHWDGIKPDGSFWSPDMNSFNHYAYGSIGDWLYRVVAGIDTDEERPGYKHIYIRPTLGEGLTYAKAELKSMYGKIKTEWRIQDGCMEISVCVPHNTTATVVLLFAKPDAVYESGKRLTEAEGILEHETVDNGVKVEIGSGEYVFRYEMQMPDVALK
ncbi:family 78 glycoside hydrolase catalytic domain [Caldicoprobacter faecalis]|uniref:alpha-L-rhamnosidase n=1 Tax=Caldicoprobacter faecalis TaxID=937334 RepID=A0A1I5XSH4_9FIRM|nr:family 78 glycoside hydrolase catalytic domain [Caldicoprobacter faecalis]SFQ34796.1 alpha-L-rhamnosidase [Caldicoprobacter faecalis]